LSLTKTTYDQVSRRIQELEMERKRPARVSIAFDADIDPVDSDKRPKATAGLMFGSFAIGVILALIREKADKSLHTPAEVAKRIGIRVIGTTTSTSSVNLAELPDIITQDYQAICSNLGVFNGEGVPARLLVTSPGIAEGKTTFAINLATSLSQAGKKVLLIDGDLRKPDVAHVLHLPKGLRGLQDAAFGKDPMASVYSVGPNGLDVLAADSRNTSDAYQLLSLIFANKVVESLSSNYDHVIIDTPPVLAFPDATIWARMADGAVLMSLAGQTTAADLNEAKEKLMPTKIKVLGIVLGNVHVGHGYHRYGYGYYSDRNRMSKQRANRKFLLLPSHGVSNDKPPEGDAV
jgi:capsular exopolysaccharide synthesis family protein